MWNAEIDISVYVLWLHCSAAIRDQTSLLKRTLLKQNFLQARSFSCYLSKNSVRPVLLPPLCPRPHARFDGADSLYVFCKEICLNIQQISALYWCSFLMSYQLFFTSEIKILQLPKKPSIYDADVCA